MEHQITRHRHETRRRRLVVQSTERITPDMIRIVVTGEDLADFVSLGADDHIKLFVQDDAGQPAMRDYTPRAYDNAARTLTIDFAVHEAGPATRWAIGAKPGDAVEIGGPRGSAVVSPTYDWWLLIGDETALPAIGRRLEELPPGASAITLGIVTGAAEEQAFTSPASLDARWVHRPLAQADDPASVLAALGDLQTPAGDGFIWVAAEARVARAVRDHFLSKGHPPTWMKAAGYWKKGEADAADKALD